MFKTKGFSSNNSLKRRAVIVDAPDLPPEEAEFYITNVGIADTEKGEVLEEKTTKLEVEALYEEEEVGKEKVTEVITDSGDYSLIDVKGIGSGMAKNLIKNGISSVDALIESDPKELALRISGISSKMISDWQTNAIALINA